MHLALALQPVRRRLPLLISVLLGVAVTVFSWGAYRQMEETLLAAGAERAQIATLRFAGVMQESAGRLRAESRRLGDDTAIRQLLFDPTEARRAALRDRLASTVAGSEPLLAMEILDSNGTAVLSVGEVPGDSSEPTSTTRPDAPDLVSFGPVRTSKGVSSYRVVTAMRGDSAPAGYVVQHRIISGAQGIELIEGMIGSDAAILLGNTDGARWTDLEKRVTGPRMVPPKGGAVSYVDASGERRIGGSAPIDGTPWMAVVTLPEGALLAPASSRAGQMTLLALAVIVAGTLGAWLVSRQITAPLAEMTSATQAMAGGDYSRRVPTGRADELGQLGEAFNTMAAQVADATHDLEARVEHRTRELREAQSALIRRERLATLGQLAGGVGHELRNPLGVMTNAVYYLDAVLGDAQPTVREYLEILRTQIGLSEKIIGDLLEYARIRTPEREPVSLSRLTAEQLERLGPLNGTSVHLEFGADLPPAYIDRVQIGQVVLNLLINAVQAMAGGGGSLTIRGMPEPADSVRLDVTDTGSGISDAHIDQIFEPLFTTKARGIGLGLAVSRSLVIANGGTISASSRAGEGTTFTLMLPTREAPE